MSDSGLGWESLLDFDGLDYGELKAALFTTYDQADDRLLAEHLLPVLLKIDRDPHAEGGDKQYYLLELDKKLQNLHGRLTIVSSTVKDEPGEAEEFDDLSYRWLWRSIRCLAVGCNGRAVQHAKLWMLHWGSRNEDENEYLELVISSANLTRQAFKGQIQAAWRVCIALQPKSLQSRLSQWGLLPEFLREMAKSSGDEVSLDRYIELLGRAECPDVTFLASVPGSYTTQQLRKTPWGSAGLKLIAPAGTGSVKASVLAPFVGIWKSDELGSWCEEFGGRPNQLSLIWIDRDHPWARSNRWILPSASLRALESSKATILKLHLTTDDQGDSDQFHDKHRCSDPRWNHSKLYQLKRGNSRRLLLTSANFSPSAWGRWKGNLLSIENFELGVSVGQVNWPFDSLEAFDELADVAAVDELPKRGGAGLWGQASWDGRRVSIEIRSPINIDLQGVLRSRSRNFQIDKWQSLGKGQWKAVVSWIDQRSPPETLQVVSGDQKIRIPIFDARDPGQRNAFIPPEVDEEFAESLRDALLLEEYGGPAADEVDPTPLRPNGVEEIDPDKDLSKQSRVEDADYSLSVFTKARRYQEIVDNWSRKIQFHWNIDALGYESENLLLDGKLLKEAFGRQALRDSQDDVCHSVGGRLAAEELDILLRHFQRQS